MRNVSKIFNYLIISLIIVSMTSCEKATSAIENNISQKEIETKELEDSLVKEKENQLNTANSTQSMLQGNEILTSLSPDGKYRAEAYGTNTNITAGGLFPYEGIRVVNADNDDVIWKMEPGYYVVNFLWSPNGRYLGIYYEARTWGESFVFDIEDKKVITLPKLVDVAPHYGEQVKPQENRPDPYFKITGWKNTETVIVEIQWNKENADYFNGQYTFNIKTNAVVYQ